MTDRVDLFGQMEIRGRGENGDEPDDHLDFQRPSNGREGGNVQRSTDGQISFDRESTEIRRDERKVGESIRIT